MREQDSESRIVKVRGSEFTLEPPTGEVILAVRSFNKAQRDGDDEQFMEAMIELAEVYVGPAALRRYLRSVKADEAGDALSDLLAAIHNEFGTDTGESSASQDS